MIEPQPAPQPQVHSRSAWSVSVLFHLCLLLAIGILGAMAPASLPPEEPERPASIVLRQITTDQQVDYLEEPTPQTMPKGADSAESQPLEQALPPEAAAPPLPSLPEADDLAPLASPLDLQLDTTGRRTASAIQSGDDQAVIEADRERQRRRAAGRPSGPAADLSLFGSSSATGHRFVFVIDRSKSMGGEGLGVLEAADGQFAAALDRLKENHSFQIIAYNDKLARHPPKELVSATPQAKEQALTFMKGLAAFRGTEHGIALLAAAYTKADVIFLLTDGGYPEPATYEMRDILNECQGRTTIHALQFGFGPVQQKTVFMQTLAEKTGGSFEYVDVSQW